MFLNSNLRQDLGNVLSSALHKCVKRYKDINSNPYIDDDEKVDNALKVSTLLEGMFYLAMTEEE